MKNLMRKLTRTTGKFTQPFAYFRIKIYLETPSKKQKNEKIFLLNNI